MPPCRLLRVACPEKYPAVVVAKTLPLGARVTRGSSIMDTCIVQIAVPDPCTVSVDTRIDYVELVRYNVRKLTRNYVVELDYGNTRRVFIYPDRIWETVYKNVIEPFIQGKSLPQQGVVLYGPPGVGKTSMARLMADMIGLYTIEITPTAVLSKYVGESEKNLMSLLNQAELYEPNLVLLDDAEWILMGRATLMSAYDAASTVFLGLVNILLNKIESWNRQRRRILVVATTNAPREKLDPALMRSGRLGKPIYVPLPDVEAVEELLRFYGVPEDKARTWAVKIVNAGLNMADATTIARALASGEEPRVEPEHGVGYRRIIPVDPGRDMERFLEELDKRYGLTDAIRTRTRIAYHVPLPSEVAVAVVSVIFGYYLKQPLILLVDPRGVDEALDAAKALNAFIVVPVDVIPQDVALLVYGKAERVIMAGNAVLRVQLPPIVPETSNSIETNRFLLKAVASYYGVAVSREDLVLAEKLQRDRLVKLLVYLASHGVSLFDVYTRYYPGR